MGPPHPKRQNNNMGGIIMDSELEQQLNDKIEDLEDELTTLREVRDDLMEENERLRNEKKEVE